MTIKRKSDLKHRYTVTVEQYDDMVSKQDGKCAICGTDKPGGKGNILHIDHDHKTNRIRGLLCVRCNQGLGFFKDNPDTLHKAIAYLAS